ncbi:hypothetical protein Zmor_001961 [Zophobas morio]|uniref:Uncharacterized protein n=1 Tax=Zophobas morio TaxID=2755281 RepID=A0AA38J8M7_9CUCU|nr:hypothetical protein Zmor_001961 [Zophobas morio]
MEKDDVVYDTNEKCENVDVDKSVPKTNLAATINNQKRREGKGDKRKQDKFVVGKNEVNQSGNDSNMCLKNEPGNNISECFGIS